MKKIITLFSIILVAGSVCTAAPKDRKKIAKVVYSSDIHCKNCANKVQENIAFEKGVEDLSVSVSDKTITIEFNTAKTDTTKLAKAISKLGYKTKVIEYKEK